MATQFAQVLAPMAPSSSVVWLSQEPPQLDSDDRVLHEAVVRPKDVPLTQPHESLVI